MPGGVSTPAGEQFTFTKDNWWVPQPVLFGVDDKAAGQPKGADIQNAAVASCILDQLQPDPKPCKTPTPRPTIKGQVAAGASVDMNAHTVGDEYATMIASSDVFSADLPSATLPEGLRGQLLSITDGDSEAAGQIRLVLGSYRQTVTISGGTGTDTFKMKFGDQKTAALAFGASAATVQGALEGLSNLGTGMVTVTKSGNAYTIELRGKLYVSNGTQFSATDLTGAESTTNPRIFSHAHAAVVVDESEGNTNVAEGSGSVATNNDTIRVRLSSDPGGNVDVTLGDHAAGLLQYFQGGVLNNVVHFNSTGSGAGYHRWDQFIAVEVRAVDDGVVRGFHKADLVATAAAYNDYVSSVSIADDNWVGARVVESNGGTSVIEFKDSDFGLTQSQAHTDGLPFQDYYSRCRRRPTQARRSASPPRPSRRARPRRAASSRSPSRSRYAWAAAARALPTPRSRPWSR